MKDVLVLVASDFEDTELISTINVLARSNISFDLVSIENLTNVKGIRFATVSTKKMSEINPDDYHALFLPGGPGHKKLLNDETTLALVKKYVAEQKIVSAICGGPAVFDKLGLLAKQPATAFDASYIPSARYIDQPVVVNRKIITGQNYLAATDLGFALVKALK